MTTCTIVKYARLIEMASSDKNKAFKTKKNDSL